MKMKITYLQEDRKFLMVFKAKYFNKKEIHSIDIKVLIPKQMIQRLLIALVK